MTDDLKQREDAVNAAANTAGQPETTPCTEEDEIAKLKAAEDKAESYLQENKGILQCLMAKIPAPIRFLVKGALKIILLPLRILAILPFRGIYTFLNDFVNKG